MEQHLFKSPVFWDLSKTVSPYNRGESIYKSKSQTSAKKSMLKSKPLILVLSPR